MINVKTIVTDLNKIKNRAVKISTDLLVVGKKSVGGWYVVTTPSVPNDQEDFSWWGIAKFMFNGSRRITQTIDSINFVFDIIEEDIKEMQEVQKNLTYLLQQIINHLGGMTGLMYGVLPNLIRHVS